MVIWRVGRYQYDETIPLFLANVQSGSEYH
jgi:hypothetical protein